MTPKDRPWTAFYGPDVRPEIEAASYRTIGEMARSVAETYGDAPAFTTCLPNGASGTLTFDQVNEMSDAFAVYLREVAGLTQGDRVALQMPNCLSFPVAVFGILKAGCVLVNVNPLYTADEMALQFADSTPHALIIADQFAEKIPKATRAHPIPNIVVARVTEYLRRLSRGIAGLVREYWGTSIKPSDITHVPMPDAIEAGREQSTSRKIDAGSYDETVKPGDIACLQYTGGTTGLPKGAMLTHANLLLNMEQTQEMISGMTAGEEVALTALSMSHIFAFTVNLLGFYQLGAHNVLIPSAHPLSNLKRAMESYDITWMSGVNPLFNGLADARWFIKAPPKHLKFASAGGMALQTEVARKWEKVTGKPVLQGYGLTETSPVLTFNPLGQARDGSIGVPVPSTDLNCLSEDGIPVQFGQRGEIAAKGPQVMVGYWNNPEETAKVMKDGWFLTGDIGIMDTDGYFRIVDRKKDMVVVSGFKVFPNEVEDCLTTHPDIQEAAVIGVPDDAAGEAVIAFVVRHGDSLTKDAVRAHCKAHLAAYKIPKQVTFCEDLPKSLAGKVLRKDLRVQALAKAAAP